VAKAKEDRPLTPRQQRFVDEYIVSLNATQAAIKAGYSTKTAEVQGSRLLRNVQVSKGVAQGMTERAEAHGITEARVLGELAAMAFSSVTHYQQNPVTGLLELAPGAPPNAMAAVSSVEYETETIGGTAEGDDAPIVRRKVKFKLWDKPGQVKLAGRYKAVAGFFEKMEVTGKDGGPLSVEDARDPRRMTTKERDARIAELLAKKGPPGSEPPA